MSKNVEAVVGAVQEMKLGGVSGCQGELTLLLLCTGGEQALLTSYLQKPAGQQRAFPPELPFTVTTANRAQGHCQTSV